VNHCEMFAFIVLLGLFPTFLAGEYVVLGLTVWRLAAVSANALLR
jgi:hypothetical protein